MQFGGGVPQFGGAQQLGGFSGGESFPYIKTKKYIFILVFRLWRCFAYDAPFIIFIDVYLK
jgi:hypothetical protein